MLLVSSIEKEFRIQYGCYPYEYYIKRRQHNHTSVEAAAKLQAAIDKVWEDMKHTASIQLAKSVVDGSCGTDLGQQAVNQTDDPDDDYYFNYIVGSYNPFLEDDD